MTGKPMDSSTRARPKGKMRLHATWQLPDYPASDFEPYLATSLVRRHRTIATAYHRTLHAILQDHHNLCGKRLHEVIKESEKQGGGCGKAIRWLALAVWNHRCLTGSLAPPGLKLNDVDLKDEIHTSFGGLTRLIEVFVAESRDLDGPGWVWLTIDTGGLYVESSVGEENPFFTKGRRTLYCIDLWNHAFRCQYASIPEYINACFNLVGWDVVERYYRRVRRPLPRSIAKPFCHEPPPSLISEVPPEVVR